MESLLNKSNEAILKDVKESVIYRQSKQLFPITSKDSEEVRQPFNKY